MIGAKIVADSVNEQGQRITSMMVTMPRIVLAEFNTHRMFSRNSASSRAIPFKKMLKNIEETPFIPIAFQKDHKGMQGTEYITDERDLARAQIEWLAARAYAVDAAKALSDVEVTKQLCNRLLEPFMYQTVLITATELENFFALRCPSYGLDSDREVRSRFRSWKDLMFYAMTELRWSRDAIAALEAMTPLERLRVNQSQAEIHIQAAAEAMWDALNESTPKQLKAGEWHVPFGDTITWEDLGFQKLYYLDATTMDKDFLKAKIATARCARLSYQTLGDNPKIDYEADIKLHDILLASGHMSPFEHCARAMSDTEYHDYYAGSLGTYFEDEVGNIPGYGWYGNFRGFIQYRKLIPGEAVHKQ